MWQNDNKQHDKSTPVLIQNDNQYSNKMTILQNFTDKMTKWQKNSDKLTKINNLWMVASVWVD